jgi:hypothetical protein
MNVSSKRKTMTDKPAPKALRKEINDQAALLARVLLLKKHYEGGRIATLSSHEVNPGLAKGSRENFLYFTLPPAINFRRSSPAMWKSALATWNDPKTNYLFFPEKTATVPHTKIQKDLTRYGLAIQVNKHPEIWTKISKTLHEYFDDDPRKVIAAGEKDAKKILSLMQIERPELFPYLRGLKMANYWLYILTRFTDVKLSSRESISIIPDTHVIQCSIKLGLVPQDTTALEVARAWEQLLSESGVAPVDLHATLWNWSRNNFFLKCNDRSQRVQF